MSTSAEAIWKEMLTLYPTREVVLLLCMQSNRKAKLCFYILLTIIIMFQSLFLYIRICRHIEVFLYEHIKQLGN